MNHSYNENTFFNTLCIITTGVILLCCYWFRLGLLTVITPVQYIMIFSLASVFFILPDFLHNYFSPSKAWFRNNEFYALIIIIVFSALGILFQSQIHFIKYGIIPIGIFLSVWELIRFFRSKKILSLFAGLVFMVFLIVLFYSIGYHSFLFPEKIILGKAHIDTLFHSSISSMLSTFGWPSTGLNGTPYFKYHWGSHAIIAGLKPWIGLNSLMIYNIVYPAIFMPLFIKYFLSFTRKIFVFKGFHSFNVLFAISFLTLLYSLPISSIRNAHPMSSESFTMSLIFTLIYLSIILSQPLKQNQQSPLFKNSFFWFSLVILLLITITKISTGISLIVGISYLYFRLDKKPINLLTLMTGGLIVAIISYILIFPVDRTTIHVSLIKRIYSFWMLSDSFITYLLGGFVAIIVIIKNNYCNNIKEWIQIFKLKEYLFFEILFVITVSSLLFAIAVSSNASDVCYFCLTQFYLTIPILMVYSQIYFDKFKASQNIKTAFMVMIVILSVASRPDLLKIKGGFLEMVQLKKEMHSLNKNQQIYACFVSELFTLDSENDKKRSCVYIPKTEKWYYESQAFNPLGLGDVSAPMVTPAISGIAMIGGIPDSIQKSNYCYYSYYFYKKYGIQPNSSLEAKTIMQQRGFNKMIEFKIVDNKLTTKYFYGQSTN